jgi:hypothetical protein
MDVLSPAAWKQQLDVLMSAPYVIAPLVIIVACAVWWLRGKLLEGAIAEKEERIKFAQERIAGTQEAREILESQLRRLEAISQAGRLRKLLFALWTEFPRH